MTSCSPKISILMATHNGEAFVEEAIKSVLRQSYENIDLLIADDASSDETLEICKSLAIEDDRIRLIERKENFGSFSNFEFLVSNAHLESKYIKFLDQDDTLINSNFVEEAISVLESGYDYILSDVRIMDTKSSIKNSIMDPYIGCKTNYEFSLASLEESAMIFYATFKKSIFLENKYILFDLRPKHIINFFEGIFNHVVASNCKGYFLSTISMGYRIHPNSVSSSALATDLVRDYHYYFSSTLKTFFRISTLPGLEKMFFLFSFILKKSRYLFFSLYLSLIKVKLNKRQPDA